MAAASHEDYVHLIRVMGAGGEALLNPVLHTLRYRKVDSDRCLQSLLVKLGRRLALLRQVPVTSRTQLN